ncbi:hypothetical protein CRUP_030004, partial [Coryphaenoides rupestris]
MPTLSSHAPSCTASVLSPAHVFVRRTTVALSQRKTEQPVALPEDECHRIFITHKEEEDEPKLTCEYCGWVDLAYKFKGAKRFCSVVCAKRYNVGCSKRMGLFHPERSKPTNHWRKRSQGHPVTEAKKR